LGLVVQTPECYSSSTRFDALHSVAWQREVIEPLLTDDPTLVPLIAEGALMRLGFAARCFERYRKELCSLDRLVASFEYADGPDRSNLPAGERQARPPLREEPRSWPAEALPCQPFPIRSPQGDATVRPRWPEMRRAH